MSVLTYTFDARTIHEIDNNLPCHVFVSQAAVETDLRVTATSAGNLPIDALRIAQRNATLCLEWASPITEPMTLLIEIFASADALKCTKFVNSGPGGLYVDHWPLGPIAADLTLIQNGSGRVCLRTAHASVATLRAQTNGSGRVQLEAASLVVDTIECATHGSGVTQLSVGAVTATSVDCSVAGSGSIHIASPKAFTAASIQCAVSGSGTLSFAGHGTCQRVAIQVAGSGRVRTDAVAGHEAHIEIAGSGSVVARATDELEAKVAGSGVVRCVAPVPPMVSGHITTLETAPSVPDHSCSMFPAREPTQCSGCDSSCRLM